jgi:hypothetical protein
MGLVLGLAVAIAALRNADDHWAGGLLLATALLIGVAALGAVYHSGRRRAGRLGFAVFAGGYFALVFFGLSDPNVNRLPTTWLLLYVHQEAVAPITFTAALLPSLPPSGATTTESNSVQHHIAWQYSTVSPNRWNAMIPGAANYEAFSIVGHCLFALLAGLLGIVITTRYQARQDSARSDR